MITYPTGAFGFQILFRLHGSAVFKSLLPALISSVIYVLLYQFVVLEQEDDAVALMDHPYPIGALIAAFTYLLSFRANFAYNRYWEAFTAVHAMHSKWLDVGTDLAAFHLQSTRYNDSKPPTFGENPHLTSLERERECHEKTFQEIKQQIDEVHDKYLEENSRSRFSKWRLKRLRRRKNRKSRATSKQQQPAVVPQEEETKSNGKERGQTPRRAPSRRKAQKRTSAILEKRLRETAKNINAPPKFHKKRKGTTHRRVVSAVSMYAGNEKNQALIDKRPLFLQEAAHLLSLLSAVAMSTLRNDLETAESPLVPFTPGAPFPCVDPDGITADIRTDWDRNPNQRWATIRYLFGFSRTEKARIIYNAARPFRVIGGISDNEQLLLQAARGPQAKVNLVSFWVQEYISREYLAGSVGKVAPPILSRLYQYVSDGCLNYNQARKIAYIPFPFPHAQITSIFVLVIVGAIPVLMIGFVNNEAVGFILNLLTVMCFAGLHEVTRELESPFQNAPNDLPANNFHAQYNEALMSMFAGYHPDAYWEVQETASVIEESDDDIPPESIEFGDLVTGESGESDQQIPPLESMNFGDLVAGLQGVGGEASVQLDQRKSFINAGANASLGDSFVVTDAAPNGKANTSFNDSLGMQHPAEKTLWS